MVDAPLTATSPESRPAFNNPRHPRHLHSSGHHRKAICADSCR